MTAFRLDAKNRPLYPLIAAAQSFADELRRVTDFHTGVPDSMFKKVIPALPGFVMAPRENHALAMAFGARLGGRRPALLIQNSGLGLLGDALYGLQHLNRAGAVMVVTARGELPWEEPQHHHWGARTLDFLKVLDVEVFDFGERGLEALHAAADRAFSAETVTAVLLHRGNIDE